MSQVHNVRYGHNEVENSQEMPVLDNVPVGGHRLVQEGSMTYIVIVNKNTGQETKAQIPTKQLLKHSDLSKMVNSTDVTKKKQAVTEKRMPPLELKAKTKSFIRSRGTVGADAVKLNFTSMGFDDYDSSTTAQNVFNDDVDTVEDRNGQASVPKSQDEGFSEPSGSGKRTSVYSHCSVTEEDEDPSLDLTSPTANTVTKTVTPATSHVDMSGSSGYYSDNSSFLSPTFNTPSPSTIASSRYEAAWKMHSVSPGSQHLKSNTPEGVAGQSSMESPVTSLASNFRSVAFFQSPSPVASEVTKAVQFVSDQHHCTTGSLLPGGIPTPKSMEQLVQVRTSTPRVTTIQSTSSAAATRLPPNTTSIKSLNIKLPQMSQIPKSKTIVVQRKSSTGIQPSGETRPLGHSVEKVDGVVLHFNVTKTETVVQVTEDSDSKEDTLSSSQESSQSEKEILNNSLTNMHWLEGMQGINDQGSEQAKSGKCEEPKPRESTVTNPVQWRYLSPAEVAKIAKDCGRSKRPPFSYMTLIQMALNSREDKRMTLREICRWIEDTFPYYRYTAKPGWKNSIRHNLSLYSIFEREKTKKHGSYWTVREDCPEKSKSIPSKDSCRKGTSPVSGMATMFPLMPTILHPAHGLKLPIPHSTAMPTIPVLGDSKKRAPQPILPRPVAYSSTPMQTYALIPIQNVSQGLQMSQGATGQPPVILQVPGGQKNPTAVKLFPGNQEQSDGKEKKQTTKQRYSNIAPKSTSGAGNISIVRQAWLNSSDAERTASDATDSEMLECKVEPENDEDIEYSCDIVKKARIKPGLPTPKFYTRRTPPSRKTKTRRKQKLIPKERDLMQDSSDEESSKFIEGLEKELPTPVRNFIPENVTTSTPFKKTISSPQLLSPIRVITPLKGSNLLDGSFLDCLKDSDSDGGKAFVISPDLLSAKRTSPERLKSLNLSQLENFSFSFTPFKSENGQDLGGGDQNQSLSKFLAEFPIDSQMMEEEALPVDLSLNWSNVGQEPTNSEAS